ncbi:MAG: hypothetical protein Q8P30_00055 [Candidatus Uhrbacteria bacterium]|nr:hypothetical protein [Candidatus Uhrbacteria bacterium]
MTLVVLDEILQGIMVAPALKELTRRDEIEQEELILRKEVRYEVDEWSAIYCAKLIGEGRVAELPEKVAIPLESIVPIRGEINELQRRVLESVSSLVVRTGEWAIANIEIDRTARTVYLVVRPTEAVRDRLEAGRRSVPLR